MPPIVIKQGRASAAIAPELGFNCFSFQVGVGKSTVEVLDSSPDFASGGHRPSGNGIPILFPFPNRIRDGRYHWEGREYQVPLAPNHSNAIHGFALDRPWRVVKHGANFVVGQFQLSLDDPDRAACWPSDALIEVRYSLKENVLRADIRIANPDARPLPWGFGTHAYFKLPLAEGSGVDHCLVQAPAYQQWDLQEFLPTGTKSPLSEEKDISRGVYVGRTPLDDVLTDLRPEGEVLECIIMDERSGLEVVQACDPVFRELVVYTPPDRAAVCMEPYTCVTDAINLQSQGIDAGLRVLEPGGEFRTWIEITARPVLA